MITVYTPQGEVTIDPATVTDAELAALGLTRAWADEQAYQEQLAAEFNAAHDQAIQAYKNWPNLTLAQKDAVLKNLVKWALWRDGWLKLGVL